MKSLTTLVVLFTALFVTLDAAPVLPSDFEAELEAVGRQQSYGSIQADNALERTLLNLASSFLSSASKKNNPNDKLQRSLFNGFNSILSSIGNWLGDDGKEIQSNDEIAQIFMNLFGSLPSAMTKKIDNGEIQSADEIVPAFLNLMGNMLSLASKNTDTNDDVARSFLNGFSTILSAVGRKFNDGGGSQIQSNNELLGATLNLFGSWLSALQKIVNLNDDVSQTLLSIFNTMISAVKNGIGGGQEEVHVDTLPYTAKHFDRSILESVDENAAMVEADSDLIDEAKAQFWGAVLRTLDPIVLKRVLDG